MALVVFACPVFAHEEDVDLGTSPDGRYRVRVVERGKARQISYEIVTARGGKVLHRIPSSYQPEDDFKDWDWEWRISTEAEVRWKPTSHYVAIDEQVHQCSGCVFLTEVSGGRARNIALPEDAILARTGWRWERYRIRTAGDGETWLSVHKLRLGLAGRNITSTAADGHYTFDNTSFTCTLRVDHGKAVVLSVEEDHR